MRGPLMLFGCIVTAIAAKNLISEQSHEWENFKATFGKTYSVIEEPIRKQNFFDMIDKIEAQNRKYSEKQSTFYAGINAFSDMTHEEFVKTRTMKPNNQTRFVTAPKIHQSVENVTLPDSVNWRNSCVSVIKNQGQCGSSWAFVAVDTIECQNVIVNGLYLSLSEQNLIDCTLLYGNLACNSGSADAGYQYIIDNGGIDTASSYPYEEKLGKCRYTLANRGASLTGFADVPLDDYDLQYALAFVGPLAVFVDSSHATFQLYSGGIYDVNCLLQEYNDYVLLIGYGTKDGEDYWLIQNSWGITWGMNGTMMMARKSDCPAFGSASYPIM